MQRPAQTVMDAVIEAVQVGPLTLVGRRAILSKRRMAEIEFALILAGDDEGAIRRAGDSAIRRIEADLGVTERHRVAAAAPPGAVVGAFVPVDGAREALCRLQRRRAILARSAPRRPSAAEPQACLTKGEAKRLAKAEAAVAARPGDLESRKRLAAEASLVAGELAERVEASRLAADRLETETLERLRGERVEHEPGVGAARRTRLRIASRDGLEMLARSGALDRRLFTAGMRYREQMELLDPERGLSPPAWDAARMAGAGRTGVAARAGLGGGDGWARRRAQAAERLAALERAIQGKDPTYVGALGVAPVDRTGRSVMALREVAGKGRCIRHLVNGGSGRAAWTRALVVALDQAARWLGL